MLVELLLSMIPGIEARGASLVLACHGNYWLIPFSIVLNFAVVLVFLKILEHSLLPKKLEMFFEKRMDKHAKKLEAWFKKYGYFFLLILIALPSTGVGSFTAAFIGNVFELKGWVFYASILTGIIVSVIPVITLMYGISVFLPPCSG